jgi:hypothetical protein
MGDLTDIPLTCRDCSAEFAFTVADQVRGAPLRHARRVRARVCRVRGGVKKCGAASAPSPPARARGALPAAPSRSLGRAATHSHARAMRAWRRVRAPAARQRGGGTCASFGVPRAASLSCPRGAARRRRAAVSPCRAPAQAGRAGRLAPRWAAQGGPARLCRAARRGYGGGGEVERTRSTPPLPSPPFPARPARTTPRARPSPPPPCRPPLPRPTARRHVHSRRQQAAPC